MDSSEKIIKTLSSAGKPMKAGEISEASGIDKKEVDKVFQKLVPMAKLHSLLRCFSKISKVTIYLFFVRLIEISIPFLFQYKKNILLGLSRNKVLFIIFVYK
jgi:hypothetical protein